MSRRGDRARETEIDDLREQLGLPRSPVVPQLWLLSDDTADALERHLARTSPPRPVLVPRGEDDGRAGAERTAETASCSDLASLVADMGASHAGESPLTLADTVDLLRQIAHALRELHRQGHVHRDLRPGNVIVRRGPLSARDNRAAPMAEVAALRVDADAIQTGEHRIASAADGGRDPWTAPEQRRQLRDVGSDVGSVADVYPFGRMIRFLVYGGRGRRRPVDDDERVRRIVEQLERIAGRCLLADPRRRRRHYPDGEALERALAGVAELRPPARHVHFAAAAAGG